MDSPSTMEVMRTSLLSALDDLVSLRTSSDRKDKSLASIERLLASICVSDDPSAADRLDSFLALQDTFECNIATRLLGWISHNTLYLEQLVARESDNHDRSTESTSLMSQLTQALTIIQGVALNHKPSKSFLGRKYSLEIIVDLLNTSRRLISPPPTPEHRRHHSVSSITSQPTSPNAILQSAVLDTLLCILVDDSPALRIFEDVNGVSTIAKLLKRSTTPREVRMKSLEFLYFYLMDETVPLAGHEPRSASEPSPSMPTLVPTAPSTPTPHSKSRSLASRSLEPHASNRSLLSSRSSTSSLSDAESNGPRTPPDEAAPIQRSLAMLRKEVDYVPQSPKKERISKLGMGSRPSSSRGVSPGNISRKDLSLDATSIKIEDRSLSLLRDNSDADMSSLISPRSPTQERDRSMRFLSPSPSAERSARGTGHGRARKTTEEKTEFLSSVLGNIDALLDGVRQAGIWGLG